MVEILSHKKESLIIENIRVDTHLGHQLATDASNRQKNLWGSGSEP